MAGVGGGNGSGTAPTGLLDAAMLDMKSTFDELIVTHAGPDKARQILANPVYQSLSSSFAGTQEYMAMERLGQLLADADRTGSHDLIVVDTPPSRSALDFLDAPDRLAGFLDGRFIRLLGRPNRGPLRFLTAGLGAVTNTLTKLLGSQLLADVSSLAAALDTVFGGFRARAEQTYAILQRPSTGFVVVATPDQDALREASFFARRLAEEKMPLVGVVLNRMVISVAPLSLDRTRVTLASMPSQPASAPTPSGAARGPAVPNWAAGYSTCTPNSGWSRPLSSGKPSVSPPPTSTCPPRSCPVSRRCPRPRRAAPGRRRAGPRHAHDSGLTGRRPYPDSHGEQVRALAGA